MIASLFLLANSAALYAIPVNFDFTTAAVVSFVLLLLGMAVAFLLMLRFAGKSLQREAK